MLCIILLTWRFMIDKIKSVLSTIKSGILYVIGPVLAIVGYILYLTRKNAALQDQINQSKAAEQLATVIQKKVEDEKQSNVDQLDYESIRDKFLAESGTGSNSDLLRQSGEQSDRAVSGEPGTESNPIKVPDYSEPEQCDVSASDPSSGQGDSSQKPSS